MDAVRRSEPLRSRQFGRCDCQLRNERQEKVHVPVDILLTDNDADLCHCRLCVCVNELRKARQHHPLKQFVSKEKKKPAHFHRWVVYIYYLFIRGVYTTTSAFDV